MKRKIPVSIAAVLLALTFAVAEEMNELVPMEGGVPMDGKVPTQSYHGRGMINSVDAKAGSIKLSFDPIASLGWPKQTMDIEVLDKALLHRLKRGQHVIFELIEVGKGKYAIAAIGVTK